MDREFEVEIDGAVFKVKQILPEDDGTEYGEEEAELIARACLLAEDEAEKKAQLSKKQSYSEKTPEAKGEEKIKETFRRQVTEKYVEGQMEKLSKGAEISARETSLNKNYRRQIEELSRYLSRDSRRYDGYFEMY